MQHATNEYKQKVRMKAAALFAEGNHSYSEIGRKLGVSKQSISKWYQVWQADGESGLAIKKAGRKAGMTDEQWQEVQSALLEGALSQGYDTDLWTLGRIADLIKKKTGIRYSRGYLWRLLKRKGWSYQKPEKVAKQRDEEAIAYWKRECWPVIKKGRKRPVPG